MSDEVIFRAVAGSLKGEEFVFDEKGLCLIGRSNDCALQIPKENDMRISRRHCLIILNPPFVSVRDLNSRNGTFVNDVRLDPGVIGDKPSEETSVDVVLKDGDVVSLGETILEFELPSQQNVASPMKQQPPQGTKVIKLARPSKTHTGTLVPKAATADTGFFKSPALPNGQPDLPPPMTELFAKPKENDPVASDVKEPSSTQTASAPIAKEPIKLGGANQGAATIAQPVSTLPAASAPPVKKPIRLGGAAQGGAAIAAPAPAAAAPASAPPLKKQPIKLGGARKGPATVAQPVSTLPAASAPAVKKPIRLGGAAQGGATIAAPAPAAAAPASAPPLKKQPIKLGGASKELAKVAQPVSTLPATSAPAVKKPISLGQSKKSHPPLTTKPPMVLGAKPKSPIQLNKSSVAQAAPVEEAPSQPEEIPAAAPVAKPAAKLAKKPIILNRKPKSAGTAAGAKPPVKAKTAGAKPDNIDLTEVLDVSELSDDLALSAEFIRKENRKKRVTKFKIKGPK